MAKARIILDQITYNSPKILGYFIMLTIALVVMIVSVQLCQDFHLKKESFDSKQIASYYDELEIVADLMDTLKSISMSSEVNAEDSNELVNHANELSRFHESVLAGQYREPHVNFNHAEIDKGGFPAKLLIAANEVLVAIESNSYNSLTVAKKHTDLLDDYSVYREKVRAVIASINAQLELEFEQHRRITWGTMLIKVVLITIMATAVYRLVSNLIRKQFELLQQDNQARVEHEKELLAQHMKLKSILDSTVNSVLTVTADGDITSFNKIAEKMFGYPAEHVIGKKVTLLMPEGQRQEYQRYLHGYVSNIKHSQLVQGREFIAKRIDGSEFPVYLSLNVVENSEGKLFTGIIQDITAWKEADKKLHDTLEELTDKQNMLAEEEAIAKHVFEKITSTNNANLRELSSWCKPMGSFSGDMMLSSVLPCGGIRILLCDFTGHGLPAALGAIPVSTIHTAIAVKGLPLEVLMDELNDKLKELLPTGLFCCVAGIDIDVTRTRAHIWNAGLPELLLLSKEGEIKRRFSSNHLPLGVVAYTQDELHCEDLLLDIGDMIYALSDGLTEAENEEGEMFGQTRFEAILQTETDENGRLDRIKSEVIEFAGNAPATDDVSLIELKILAAEE